MLITETQMKLGAIFQGLILPMSFEETSIEEITQIAYSNIHSNKSVYSNWVKLLNAYNWLKSNPYCDWDNRLLNDKFGFFADNMNKSIQTFKKNGLIRYREYRNGFLCVY